MDDHGLRAQHSPLMSPLVWDLAHIGNQEELWLLRAWAGVSRCDPRWTGSTTPSSTPGRAGPHCRCSRPPRPGRTPPMCAAAPWTCSKALRSTAADAPGAGRLRLRHDRPA
ncbi:DinB family protein [Streptomyces sp. M10(2022)]